LIVPLGLAHLLATCAPRVGRVTMSAIVVYESGARRYAIGDNTTRRSYFPGDRRRAEALADSLLRAGHNIDVGYAQINSGNFARLGLDAHRALAPCENLQAGASILARDYAGAARSYGPGQTALLHALSAYNTGGYWAGLGYANGVYATAASLRSSDGSRLSVASIRAVPIYHPAPHFHTGRR
jgi:type IV secretion system protein VirB1